MRTRLVLASTLCLASSLAAQGSTALYTRWFGLSGFEFQSYSFSGNPGVERASQWSIPIVVVAPLGRHMSLDLTSHVAGTRITGAADASFTGLTDTQLRLLYTLNRDRAVASLALNLPTGKRSLSTSQFQVSSALGSNFLSFPVSNLGTAFGVTGGLAYAVRAGAWNFGFAGSARFAGSYRPFTDTSQNVFYNPGLEGRLRAGADRVIGERSRLLLGLTYSTFSTDEFSGTGTLAAGFYNPGSRFIGDLGYAYSWGRTTLALTAWDYYRLGGRSAGGSDTKENVFNIDLRLARQLSQRVTLEPLVGFRQWSPADYRGGRLLTFGLNGRMSLSDRFSAITGARIGPGWVYQPGVGRSDVTATGVSVLIRYQR
ncbi:MAG: hypothetical protein ACREMF_10455 [Gemmatimonadales bacterium]